MQWRTRHPHCRKLCPCIVQYCTHSWELYDAPHRMLMALVKMPYLQANPTWIILLQNETVSPVYRLLGSEAWRPPKIWKICMVPKWYATTCCRQCDNIIIWYIMLTPGPGWHTLFAQRITSSHILTGLYLSTPSNLMYTNFAIQANNLCISTSKDALLDYQCQQCI